jgi:hypothetical protein
MEEQKLQITLGNTKYSEYIPLLLENGMTSELLAQLPIEQLILIQKSHLTSIKIGDLIQLKKMCSENLHGNPSVIKRLLDSTPIHDKIEKVLNIRKNLSF